MMFNQRGAGSPLFLFPVPSLASFPDFFLAQIRRSRHNQHSTGLHAAAVGRRPLRAACPSILGPACRQGRCSPVAFFDEDFVMASIPPPPLDQVDPVEAWQPWEPTATEPWNLKWAGHLYRRAAFGASPAEMTEAVSRGLPATLERLFKGAPDSDDIEKTLVAVGARTADRANPFELRAWWLYAMLNGGRPVQEKMTLFWHNHFATSIAKVQRTTLMFDQNRLIRKHALGKFGPFLHDMSRDAAMIVWLDNNSNVKAHPNENYAREVMELFSLGVGHYTEKDIREAARAFTGWHTNGGEYDFNARFHDDGEKTVLGQTGNWNGDDVLDILLKQPRLRRVPGRASSTAISSARLHDPPAKLIAPLAESFRKTRLRHRATSCGECCRRATSSPTMPTGNGSRARSSTSSARCGRMSRTATVRRRSRWWAAWTLMGQQLFAPPNVKGWPRRPGLAEHVHRAGPRQLRPGPRHGGPVERPVARRRGRADAVRAAGHPRPAGRENARGAAAAGEPGRGPPDPPGQGDEARRGGARPDRRLAARRRRRRRPLPADGLRRRRQADRRQARPPRPRGRPRDSVACRSTSWRKRRTGQSRDR